MTRVERVAPVAPVAPVATRRPLVLVATSLSSRAEESFATIRGPQGEGAYWTGQRIPGAGVVEKVGGMSVVFRNDAGGLERLALNEGDEAPAVDKPATQPARDVGGGQARVSKGGTDWSDKINKLGENSFEVDRQLIRDLVGQGSRVPGVRMMPVMKDGQVAGMKVSMARKDSLAAAVGLKTGDVIQAVNGTSLTTAEAALAMYGQLEQTSNVTVTVERQGQKVNLDYKLR